MSNTRLQSIDLLKGYAVLAMVFIHIPMIFISPEYKSSTIYLILNTFAFFSAPIFLFFVGFNLNTSKHSNKQTEKHLYKKILIIGLFGLLLMAVWTADILHIIALFTLLGLFIKPLSIKLKGIIMAFILILSEIFLVLFDYMSNWANIPFMYTNLWTLEGFSKHLLFNGVYPFFPWFIFTILGLIISELFEKTTTAKFSQLLLTTGVISGIISLLLYSYADIPYTFYPARISYILLGISVVCLLFNFFYSMFDIKSRNKQYLSKYIKNIGSSSLSWYILHILIAIIPLSYILSKKLSLGIVLLYSLFSIIIIYFIIEFTKNKIGYGPFEYISRSFS